MCGPACVANSRLAVDRVRGDQLDKFLDTSDSLTDADFVAVLHGDARTVVAAIFETAETFEQVFGSRAKTNVADDSTHGRTPSFSEATGNEVVRSPWDRPYWRNHHLRG